MKLFSPLPCGFAEVVTSLSSGGSTIERIEISPHCSLSWHGAATFFGSLCFVSFAIAGLLAIQGFWPILLFAALEMLLLGWALKRSMDRRHHSETITISEDDVAIESCDRRCSACVVFSRHWTQVKLRPGYSPLHPSRLSIESRGRRCEIGSFLTEQERLGLAQRLERLIGRISESPQVAP